MWTSELKRDAFRAWFDSGVETQLVWKGTQILKFPGDLFTAAEIIWETKPDVLVETGTWHGGSACFYGDLGVEVHSVDLAPSRTPTPHPKVTYHRGYSVSPRNLYLIGEACRGRRVMVVLDSDHHKQTVLDELEAYGPLVSSGCYLIVEDTHLGRSVWLEEFGGDGPADALDVWLPDHSEFTVDSSREKHGFTQHPGGYLLRS